MAAFGSGNTHLGFLLTSDMSATAMLIPPPQQGPRIKISLEPALSLLLLIPSLTVCSCLRAERAILLMIEKFWGAFPARFLWSSSGITRPMPNAGRSLWPSASGWLSWRCLHLPLGWICRTLWRSVLLLWTWWNVHYPTWLLCWAMASAAHPP